MFISIKCRSLSKLGHVQLKTRSLGQIIEKPCKHSRGHIFCLIFMKLGQNVHLNQIQVKCKSGSCMAKNQVSRSNHRKSLLTLQKSHFLPNLHKTWSECSFSSNVHQFPNWVMCGLKLGHQVKSQKTLVNTLEVTFSA